MSKGSRPRPFSVSQQEFNSNFDSIFGKRPPRPQWTPPGLPTQTPSQQSGSTQPPKTESTA